MSSSELDLILIVQATATTHPFRFNSQASGAELKLALGEVVGLPSGSQVRMVVGGRVLKEDCSLSEQGKSRERIKDNYYCVGIKSGSKVYISYTGSASNNRIGSITATTSAPRDDPLMAPLMKVFPNKSIIILIFLVLG